MTPSLPYIIIIADLLFSVNTFLQNFLNFVSKGFNLCADRLCVGVSLFTLTATELLTIDDVTDEPHFSHLSLHYYNTTALEKTQ